MSDWIGDLERLRALREAGHMTDAEFDAAKVRVLAVRESESVRPVSEPSPAMTIDATKEASEFCEDQPASGYVEEVGVHRNWFSLVALVGAVGLAIAAFLFWYSGKAGERLPERTAIPNITDVNCRTEPYLGSPSKRLIFKGDAFVVRDEQDGWVKSVRDSCWVNASNLIIRAADFDEVENPTGGEAGTDLNASDRLANAVVPIHSPSESEYIAKPGRYTAYGDTQYTAEQTASFNRACEGMTLQNNVLGTSVPSYQAGFSAPDLPDNFLRDNRAVWSTPTTSGNECRVRIEAYGTVKGTMKAFDRQCRVTALTVQDDGKIALDGVDWADCQ